MLLLATLGCSICPGVPRLPVASVTPPPALTATTIPEATATSELAPTVEVPAEMSPYANPLAGFSLLYPADWVYDERIDGVFFAEDEEALDISDPAETPIFVVLAGRPTDIQDSFGGAATPHGLLDGVVQNLCGEDGCEVGEVESWTFGEIPGAGVSLAWLDGESVEARGYVIAALGEEVAGVGVGAAPEASWSAYEPVFFEMFASLTFFQPEVPEPVERGPIEPGETVEGTLPLGGVDIWYFEAEEGQYVTVNLDAIDPDALDPYLELYDEAGDLVAENDDGGEGTNSLIIDFPVTTSGTYYVHALTYEGMGDYRLGLELSEEPSGGGEIGYGETVEDAISGLARHEWVFDGESGDVVTILMNALDSEIDCYLELYGPDGLLLTEDDDSGEEFNALIEYYTLPEEGTYRIVTSDAWGEGGAYELTLRQAELVTEGTLTYGEPTGARLQPGTRHHWLFEGEEDQVVNIAMTSGDMDSYLELFAPNGVQIATDDDGGIDANALISELRLPLSGTYRILARGYGDEDAGEYELELTLVRP